MNKEKGNVSWHVCSFVFWSSIKHSSGHGFPLFTRTFLGSSIDSQQESSCKHTEITPPTSLVYFCFIILFYNKNRKAHLDFPLEILLHLLVFISQHIFSSLFCTAIAKIGRGLQLRVNICLLSWTFVSAHI